MLKLLWQLEATNHVEFSLGLHFSKLRCCLLSPSTMYCTSEYLGVHQNTFPPWTHFDLNPVDMQVFEFHLKKNTQVLQ